MQNYFYPHFYIKSIFTPYKGQCTFLRKICHALYLIYMHMFSFFFKQKNLITTLKFNPSFSIMVKRILLQAHLPLLTRFMYILILFAWLKLILHMNSLCFVTFLLLWGGIFKEWSRSTPRPLKGGDKIPKRRGAYLLTSSHILGMNPPMGLKS